MIGGFISRGLILIFGYAYPAYECFKTVEKNRVEIQELRFWCQYWIIVAVMTVLERIADTFVSWLPMYGEMKLALIIYLWYPKTKGTGYVYESYLRPYLSKHERDIDRSLLEFRERAWNTAIFYCQNCKQLGSAKIVQLLQFVASQSARITPGSETVENQHPNGAAAAPPPTPPSTPSKLAKKIDTENPRRLITRIQRGDTESPRRPITPSRSSSFQRAQTTKSESFRVQTQSINTEDVVIDDDEDDISSHATTDCLDEKSGVEHHLHSARLKLRRSKCSD